MWYFMSITFNTVAEVEAEIKRVLAMPHHYDMYGHQPGCGVCGEVDRLGAYLRWLKGCTICKKPFNTHIGHVGGMSGICPKIPKSF